jgi:hypothetical protein
MTVPSNLRGVVKRGPGGGDFGRKSFLGVWLWMSCEEQLADGSGARFGTPYVVALI